MSGRDYVTRGGQKLAAALDAFAISVSGKTCADLGSHAGGFVDCLLQHGAARVFAVDTSYGVLDYRLRTDPRVVVCERRNAIHFSPSAPCDLITIDVGWTPQRLILPAARRMLTANSEAQVITLVKPHYEAPREILRGGVLHPDRLSEVCDRCRHDVEDLGWVIGDAIESPIRGHGGNVEYLWHLTRSAP